MPKEHLNPKMLFPSLPHGFSQIVVASGRIYIVNCQAESADAVGGALREIFSRENPPASTWIGISALAVPDFLIEIEAIAVLD